MSEDSSKDVAGMTDAAGAEVVPEKVWRALPMAPLPRHMWEEAEAVEASAMSSADKADRHTFAEIRESLPPHTVGVDPAGIVLTMEERLVRAADAGEVDLVEELLATPGIDVDRMVYLTWSTEYLGFLDPKVASMQTLSVAIKWQASALYMAARSGNAEIVQMLVEAGADVEVGSSRLAPPLIAACFCNHRDVAELLLGYGANVHGAARGGYTSALAAAQEGHLEMVKWLWDEHECRAKARDGSTALHIACIEGHMDVVRWLVEEARCELNALDSRGFTPLCVATERGHVDVVSWLLAQPDIEVPQQAFGMSLADVAVWGGSLETVLAVAAARGPNFSPQHGLRLAVEETDAEVVKLVLAHVGTLSARDVVAAGALNRVTALRLFAAHNAMHGNSIDFETCTSIVASRIRGDSLSLRWMEWWAGIAALTTEWSYELHKWFPSRVRAAIEQVLIIARARRDNAYAAASTTFLPHLPNELLMVLFSWIATPPWPEADVS
ncbi:uncharacterized protein AMSG_10181 [Thecamonas trahens ATCC 50062]|uniref:Uncharacterized protein n=1 Tax=Thecamonas trahens ATCC 50062 TaxID=461836 RepID=A0A0L0DRL6_THETB|nr:hypothetical protein AMSG_10181 [Thecamonas trahens ATCC 50062]KNC54940.1 hypothetical protein AMSG_10181 [Thecamonas trahens ATCC 50062]|eukprot:XP_013753390.1 hypothetical protein AMSG_10181 [Thecamonas trahens ATCC 50062]